MKKYCYNCKHMRRSFNNSVCKLTKTVTKYNDGTSFIDIENVDNINVNYDCKNYTISTFLDKLIKLINSIVDSFLNSCDY